MGTVHKFRRPPKNEKQFRGYRPQPLQAPRERKAPRLRLDGWRGSTIVWLGLISLAAGIWALGS